MSLVREFDLGDLVELKNEEGYAEVVGVIHDSERLFIYFPGSEEIEAHFSMVWKQWREVIV